MQDKKLILMSYLQSMPKTHDKQISGGKCYMITQSQWQRDILGLECPPGDVVQIIIKCNGLNYTAVFLSVQK